MSFSMLKFESTSRKKYFKNKKNKRLEESFELNRQFGGSNSQLHKKMQKVPVGGGAGWENCQLGDKIEPLDGRFFFQF